MLRIAIGMLVGIFGSLVVGQLAIAQGNAAPGNLAPDSSRRASGVRVVIESEDVFDRLAPLVKPKPEEAKEDVPAGDAEAVIVDPIPARQVPRAEPPLVKLQPEPIESHVAENEQPATTPKTFARVEAILDSGAEETSASFPVLTDLTNDELQFLLRQASRSLSAELGEVHYGDHWQKYLRLPELDAQQSLTSDVFLKTLLKSYDKIAQDRQYDTIARRRNFKLLHQGLAEYLAPAEGRPDRHRAGLAVAQLHQALTPLPTGHQWLEFFEIQRVVQLLTTPRELTRDEKGQMQLILARFETAAVEPRFAQVAKLPGFADTHRRLQLAAIIPDEENSNIVRRQTPGTPVPEGEAPDIRVVAEEGLAFVRAADATKWDLADGSTTLATGTSVRTNENGVARLIIGSDAQVICSPNSVLHVSQYVDDNRTIVTQLQLEQGNLKVAASARADLSPEPEAAQSNRQLAIVYKGHRLVSQSLDLELNLQHEPRSERVIATVYAGAVAATHDAGDEVTIRVGREAVMLPAGTAIRAAAKKPDGWWPTRGVRAAAESDDGFSR